MDRIAREIFVFESNVLGEHTSGMALDALTHHGAVIGCGSGIQGDSYAIPTFDSQGASYSIGMIAFYVKIFVSYTHRARYHPEHILTFKVPRIAADRFPVSTIAPLFRGYCENTVFPEEFYAILDHLPDRCYLDTVRKKDGK